MSDFFQNGRVTTLHNMSNRSDDALEKELNGFSKKVNLGLILPSLFSELERPALGNILDELSQVDYLKQIVIGIDQADREQFKYASEFFSRLPQEHDLLWNDGPNLLSIDKKLREQGLAPTERGKGRNVWYCIGYMLAKQNTEAIAIHDCDIITYKKTMLSRLLYPLANPKFNYEFCKGYYSRVANNSMNGRVSRLLVSPLVRALNHQHGPHGYLEFLDSFRYPLAGEFSMTHGVLKDLRIPTDWGLEVGILMEMKKNYTTSHICQVDIADNYDHKHQVLSKEDCEKGLSKMSIDIAKAMFKKLATDGITFTDESLRTTKATYYRIALDLIESYRNDAIFNGLNYETHVEEMMVELFAKNIKHAGKVFLEDTDKAPFIPSWRRVSSAIPDIFDQLIAAVEADKEEFR
ncbi:MAG: glycosyl transferase [Gammaproteobacteria bacterium]|jgi:glucosyl-3-phosphoglycerate synthase